MLTKPVSWLTVKPGTLSVYLQTSSMVMKSWHTQKEVCPRVPHEDREGKRVHMSCF